MFEKLKRLFMREKGCNMMSWAEDEVRIACKNEREKAPEGEWDYGCECYKSALKAYKALMDDGHSGLSVNITQNILNRLLDGKPLTPIVDTDDIWGMSSMPKEDRVTYQCKRMSSLFKDVYKDGTVKYNDINRAIKICIDNDSSWHSGLIDSIIDEMFPITMPYKPGNVIKVYCEDFLTDRKNGDYDTVGIFYLIKPDGEKIEINRFFKDSNNETGWEEIDELEYNERKDTQIFHLL